MAGIFNAAIFNNAIFNTDGAPPPANELDGSGLRFLRRRRPPRLEPEEIVRQQRMVQEYLDALEKKQQAAVVPPRTPARARRKIEAKALVVPVLTEAMAEAATDLQINRILEATAAKVDDRRKARAEFERRYWVAFIALSMDD